MRKLIVILLLLGGVAGIAGGPSPLMAKTPRATPLYASKVQMHFAGPNGKTRTITERIYIDAGHGCGDPGIAAAEVYKHPELAGMKLTGVTCNDSAGSARPGGAAVVLLRFASSGAVKTAVVDHLGSTDFDMKTCPFVLRQDQAALVAQEQDRFPSGKFVGAECAPRPKYLNSFTKSMN